ncbi:MAG: LytTR family DNA-binding domain-containing protein [Acidobacteriota bacterium]|nr:LytTR family DNA-binding domain-containing protein [Acidobacteriota bacterium]
MRALIVDDEPLARHGVALMLRRFKDIDVVGECGDGPSAVDRILERSPDVVFLDIQMPGMDGFDVLRALPKEDMPAVIFLTAYDRYVLRAFDFHALHYLLKPVDDTRFAAAISRARDLVDSKLKADMAQRVMKMLDGASDQYASRFAVQTGSRIQIVAAEDIEWVGSAGNYVELHVNGRSFLLRESMASLEQRLDPAKFIRIHRSRIVQSRVIVELRSIENREFKVMLSDDSEHRSSRTYADRLERWLSSGQTRETFVVS